MSNATNDKLNESPGKMNAMESDESRPVAAGKKFSDSGFYLVMLLIISGAAFYIYQDATKRYGPGLSTINTPQDAQPVAVNSETQMTAGDTAELASQATLQTGQNLEEETLNLKDRVSNKVFSIIDQVKNFVTVGDNTAEVTTETTGLEKETGSTIKQAVSKSPEASITYQLEQPKITTTAVQPAVEAETVSTTTEVSKPVIEEVEESLKLKVDAMVAKVKELVHRKNEQAATATPVSPAEINQQTQSDSGYQPYGPSSYDYRRSSSYNQGYQGGYNMPPPGYGTGPGNNYRNYTDHRNYGNYPGAYDAYQQRAYQPSDYGYNPYPPQQPYQNPNYNNSYYNDGYGNTYPANPQYQPGAGY
jgi:hypothetical protein